MLKNISYMTNGELIPVSGLKPNLTAESFSIGIDRDLISNLKITASMFKLSFMFDYISMKDIYAVRFQPEEDGFISQLAYTQAGTVALINERKSTIKLRQDGSGIRFEDTTEGFACILHACLRKLIMDFNPGTFLLSHIHELSTKFLYASLVRAFDKQYNLVDSGEDKLAAIQYACSSISAAKHFVREGDINTLAVGSTKKLFPRINEDLYITSDQIDTYDKLVKYLDSREIIPNINLETFVEIFTRKMGARTFVVLESGIDFLIDAILAKSVSRSIPSGISKTLNERQIRSISTIFLEVYKKIIINEKNKYNRPLNTDPKYTPRW